MASKTVFPFVGGCYFVLVLIPPSDFYCFLEPYFILSILFAIEGAFQGKIMRQSRTLLGIGEKEERNKTVFLQHLIFGVACFMGVCFDDTTYSLHISQAMFHSDRES